MNWVMGIAIVLNSVAILFLAGLFVLHKIDHRNGDTWEKNDDDDDQWRHRA